MQIMGKSSIQLVNVLEEEIRRIFEIRKKERKHMHVYARMQQNCYQLFPFAFAVAIYAIDNN